MRNLMHSTSVDALTHSHSVDAAVDTAPPVTSDPPPPPPPPPHVPELVTLSSGNDYFYSTNVHNMVVDGEGGDDSITLNTSATDEVNAGAGNDWVNVAGPGKFTVDGGAGSDVEISENASHADLNGNGGNDNLISFDSTAHMDGGAGSDTLIASGGRVQEIGGAGADAFVFSDTGSGLHAIVEDLSIKQHDHVDLSSFGFYDENGYHPPSLSEFSVHGNVLYVNTGGHVDVIDGVGNAIAHFGGMQGAIDHGLITMDGGKG